MFTNKICMNYRDICCLKKEIGQQMLTYILKYFRVIIYSTALSNSVNNSMISLPTSGSVSTPLRMWFNNC